MTSPASMTSHPVNPISPASSTGEPSSVPSPTLLAHVMTSPLMYPQGMTSPLTSPQGMASPHMSPQGMMSPHISPQGMTSPHMTSHVSPLSSAGHSVASPTIVAQLQASSAMSPPAVSSDVSSRFMSSPSDMSPRMMTSPTNMSPHMMTSPTNMSPRMMTSLSSHEVSSSQTSGDQQMVPVDGGRLLVNHQGAPPDYKQIDHQGDPPDYKPCMLPPCCICGDRASGFHYGANTCEACKGFFRRCLIRKKGEFQCQSGGDCDVMLGKRHACKGCRYRKCIANGMSKSAIRNGRYTHEKRTRDIMEVKKLELQSRMDPEGVMVEHEARRKELDSIIEKLIDVQLDVSRHSYESLELMHEKEKKYLEDKELDRQLFGDREYLPQEEYLAIYEMTGLDIDGRRALVGKMTKTIEHRITSFVHFSKSLPGFNEIPVQDQLYMLKASIAERWLFTYGPWVNVDTQLLIHGPLPNDVIVDIRDIMGLTNETDVESYEMLWKCFQRLQRLELTEQECVICAAICLMNRYEGLTPETQSINTACVDYLVEALEYLVPKSHDPEENMVGKIVSLMADMRNLDDFHKQLRSKVLQYSNQEALPDFMVNFLSGE